MIALALFDQCSKIATLTILHDDVDLAIGLVQHSVVISYYVGMTKLPKYINFSN